MRNRKLIIDNRISIPDKATFFFLLFSLKIILVPNIQTRTVIDYTIWGCAVFFVFLSLKSKRLGKDEISFLLPCFILVILSCIGLLQLHNSHSLTSIIALICVIVTVYSCAFLTQRVSISFIGPVYFIVSVSLILRTVGGEYLGNTIPGAMCFLTLAFCSMIMCDASAHKKLNDRLSFIISCAALAVCSYVSWTSHSRTSVFVVFIIVCFYFGFLVLKFSSKSLCIVFWLVVLCISIFLVLYTNITSISWYEKINDISRLNFGKNIDSGRPYLWKSAFENMSPWQYIVGKGTGSLPEDPIYYGTSFHNSFIQLFVQLGLIGLACFGAVLYSLWKIISSCPNDRICMFVLASFIGILVYNCFESTLLQNKAFLGMIQWLIISIGVIRVKTIKSMEKN